MHPMFTEESEIRDFIIEVCSLMYKRGTRRVPIGALMRLCGVENQNAQEWDELFFDLDEEFVESWRALQKKSRRQPRKKRTMH